jgi:malonyl-CoA O-methyltransferase
MALHLGGDYWKPTQSGFAEEIDRDTVRRLTGLTPDHFHASTYDLIDPLAPQEAAKRMGIKIDPNRFQLPSTPRPLIVEGAGGLMVPIAEKFLGIDLIAKLGLPIVLVARSTLGTINHTLLSLEAIRARKLPLAGVVINGPLTPHNREAIESYGKVRILAEIPPFPALTQDNFRQIRPHIPFALWDDEKIARADSAVA